MLQKSRSVKQNKESLTEILTIIDRLIEDTRSLTSELSPPILHQFGLGAGVEWLVETISAQEGIVIHFEDDAQPKPLEKELIAFIFRSVRELLFNIVKHAEAQEARISLERDGARVRICVEDDGAGFDAAGSGGYRPKRD